MRETTPFIPEASLLEGWRSSLRLWLCDVLLALIEVMGENALTRALETRVQVVLNRMQLEARELLFWLAWRRVASHFKIKRRPFLASRPNAAPAGFRAVAPHRLDVFAYVRAGVRGLGGGDVHAQLARLRDLLEHPGRPVARIAARMRRGLRRFGLVAVRPPALVFSLKGIFTSPAKADTS